VSSQRRDVLGGAVEDGRISFHSTETAMFRVLSDALTAADANQVTLLGLLDLSRAYYTVSQKKRPKLSITIATKLEMQKMHRVKHTKRSPIKKLGRIKFN